MQQTPRTHWLLRTANVFFVLLFLVAVGLLHWLSREYNVHFDLTQTGRHTLSEASVAAVKRLAGPLNITAFASQRGELRERIQNLIALYRYYKADIAVRFVDPDESPQEVRAADAPEGTLLFQHAESKERLAPPMRLDEEGFTNALVRLGHRGERWIVFLSGHGERSPDRQANFDLSTWAAELHKRGFKTRALSLAENPQVPENAAVLVIAGPRARLLPGEVMAIQKFLERGGNLLWLVDPGPLQGLEPVAETLGVELLPGTAIDPVSEKLIGNAAAIVVTNYGPHPVVRDFADVTLFPQAGALRLGSPNDKPADWQSTILLETKDSAWLESGSLNGPVVFDKGKDIKGPLTIAAAFARARSEPGDPAKVAGGKREQRVIVIADGDFLSNSFLGNGINLDLGLSLVNWLSRDDDYVSVPVRAARDRQLTFSYGLRIAFVSVFLFGLPLGLIGSGVGVWWRRRKR